jgi:hypothetical protein
MAAPVLGERTTTPGAPHPGAPSSSSASVEIAPAQVARLLSSWLLVVASSTWLAFKAAPSPTAALLICQPLAAWTMITLWCNRQRLHAGLVAIARRLVVRWRWRALASSLGSPEWWPELRRISTTPVGERLHLRLPIGASPSDVERITERVAVGLDVPETVAERSTGSARSLTLLLRTRDPLASPLADAWPALATILEPDGDGWPATEPLPVARTELGNLATVPLWQSSLLLGGQPGAGKSVAAWLPVLAACSHPGTIVLGIDLKGGVELGRIAARLDALATTPDDAVRLLEEVQAEVERRLGLLLAHGLEKVPEEWAARVPPLVLVIDEAAELTGSGERKRDDAAGILLRRIVARGRAAGITVLLSTQKPSSDVIPTAVRDLLRYRWAMRCGTRAAAVAVMGEAALEEGAAPHAIPIDARGVGYLTSEEGGVVRCRSWYLGPAMIARAASVAEGRRLRWSLVGRAPQWPAAPGGTGGAGPDGDGS